MNRRFSLPPRLRTIADCVPRGSRLADIGTDHGRLPVWLLLEGRIDRAVATDLREKPLGKAKALAERWRVSDRVSFRLCDGLSQVTGEEAETVVIAGMGGETIAGILQAAPWMEDARRLYLLQPMTGADGLRKYLSQNGFTISREILAEESRNLYLIFLVRYGAAPPYTESECLVGRQRPDWNDPLRGRYLARERRKLRRAAESLVSSRDPENREKRRRIEEIIADVVRMEQEWETWQP